MLILKKTSIILLLLLILLPTACSKEGPDWHSNGTFEKDLIYSLATEKLVRLRFIEDKKDEFFFEVIEIVNESPFVNNIKFKFEAGEIFSHKFKNYKEQKGRYEPGEECIFAFCDSTAEDWSINEILFIDDISKSYTDSRDKEYFELKGITEDMTSDEIVARLKELLYPNNYLMANEEELPYNEVDALALFDVVHVKYVDSKTNSTDAIRDQFIFEVVEWMNFTGSGNRIYDNGDEFNVYSAVYPGKHDISRAELLYYNHQISYKRDEENGYIIVIRYDENLNNWYILDHYFPLSDISRMHYNEAFNNAGITAEMSADEIVAKIKELIAEEKAK